MLGFDRMHIKPEDAFHIIEENDRTAYLYHAPVGAMQENEVSVTVYNSGAVLPYSMRTRGYETLTLEEGSAELTAAGKRCVIEPGDMIQIEPYMPYSLKFLSEGCKLRELFQELDRYGSHIDMTCIKNMNAGLLDDETFMKGYQKELIRLPEPEAVTADKSEMPMVMPRGKGWVTFSAKGIRMTLKVGRWQLNGNKEVWEYRIDRDRGFIFSGQNPDESIYAVCEGKMQVEAAGRMFEAVAGEFICIPQFTPFKMQASEEGAVIHDYNCKITLFRAMEEIKTESAKEGADPAAVRAKYFASNRLHLLDAYEA